MKTLKAYNCKVENDKPQDKISKVFFFQQSGFLGQIRVNSALNKICRYEIVRNEAEDGLVDYTITQQAEDISINMKRITAASFDPDMKCLLCHRERRTTEDPENFDLYMLNLKKTIEGESTGRKLCEVDIVDVSTVVKTFKVFTAPLSVFSKEEPLFCASCYLPENKDFYFLVGNNAFSLLFRTNLNNLKKSQRSQEGFEVKFE